MIEELTARAQRETLRALFPDTGDTLMNACLHGHRGRAARSKGGQSGILQAGDFIFLGGKPDRALLDWLRSFKTDYTILSGSEEWLALCERSDRPWAREKRYAFQTPERFDRARLLSLSGALPKGFALSPMDARLFALCRADAALCDLCSAFDDMEDFAHHGAGVLALWEGAPVAGASAYAWDEAGIEVEIDTLSAYRRRGLATACGAALLLACEARSLRAHWDAANDISARLAQKLGYPAPAVYEVIEWK